jgi:trans-aconitate 2-methyltransferase
MTQADWNPAQYERFKDERSKPFFDLLGLVRRRPDMRVVDLGCGTGELTRAMHESLGASETVGVDSSGAMLAKAAAFAGAGLRFEKGDIATFESPFEAERPVELIFSNAAIHWVSDHPRLLARLAAMLGPGGQLAVQIPANDDHLSHTVAAEVAREAPFGPLLGGYQRVFPNLTLEGYAVLLHRLGFKEQIVRMDVYAHLLGTRSDVVEWVKGSLLTDYEKRLPADVWPQFLARYRERLLPQLEDEAPYFYPFKRTFFWAIKAIT